MLNPVHLIELSFLLGFDLVFCLFDISPATPFFIHFCPTYLTICTPLELAAAPLQLASSHTSENWKAIGVLKIFPPELLMEG